MISAENIFTIISGLMQGTPAAVLAGAFLWGMASILLSPCHLASIPLIVGYIVKQNNAGTRKSILLSLVFAAGVFIVLVAIGGITACMGRMMGNVGRPVSFALAVLLIIVGLVIAGAVPLPDFGRTFNSNKYTGGYQGSFLIGILFGAGLGPCAFTFMIPVLSAALLTAHTAPFFSAALVLSYICGHCILLVAAGVSAGAVSKWLVFGERSLILKVIRIGCGMLVSCAGIYMFIKAMYQSSML